MIYCFLADGFEEIEAIAPIDILRRASLPILTVGVTGKTVCGAHGILMETDITIDDVEPDKMTAIILPGGMPGTSNLEADKRVSNLIDFAAKNNLLLCAICAAPMILGKKGLLSGKKATCYPGFESYLTGAEIGGAISHDANIITARGAGTALSFGYTILEALGGDAAAMQSGMCYE